MKFRNRKAHLRGMRALSLKFRVPGVVGVEYLANVQVSSPVNFLLVVGSERVCLQLFGSLKLELEVKLDFLDSTSHLRFAMPHRLSCYGYRNAENFPSDIDRLHG